MTTPILVHCTHGCGTLVVPVPDLNERVRSEPFTLLTIAAILKEAHDAQEHKQGANADDAT